MTDQPITVTEALAALERDIKDAKQLVIVLGYLLTAIVIKCGPEISKVIDSDSEEYAAVAPIVARFREEDKKS